MSLTVESWIEALESGKHQQAKGHLRRGDAFCCLGVACQVSGAGEWVVDDGDADDYGYRTEAGTRNYNFLPSVLQLDLGVTTTNGLFEFGSLPGELRDEINAICGEYNIGSLVDLNDAGVPFPLIAKVIRARPKGLFREDAA